MFHFSLAYLLLFIPITIGLYSIVPKKYRTIVLLLASYFLFWSISGKLLIFILASTFSIHHFGLWINDLNTSLNKELEDASKEEKKLIKEKYKKKKRKIGTLGVLIHLGVLILLKYTGFFATNINSLLELLNLNINLKIPEFLLPIGISFYTLEAISYIVDVSTGKIEREPSLLKLALYLAFFPYLIEGPITKYVEVKDELFKNEKIKYENLTFGLQRILYGVLKKVVVADRLNILIKGVFINYASMNGSIIFLGALFYTIQLYMEFSGTMDVAIGTAEIFGIKLPENFKQPFFSKSISEFWQRWHITLGHWFKEYIFYPISLSKPMKKLTLFGKRHLGSYYGPLLAGTVALFSVWISNGLWHGADWKYIFFGMYHFALILLGNLTEPLFRSLCEKLKINRESKAYAAFRIIRTFILVIFGELFFRATTLTSGFEMCKLIFTNFDITTIFSETIFTLGLDIFDFLIIFITLIVVLIISIQREKGKNVRESIAKKNIILRWTIYYILILSIIIFGAYGNNYVPVEPIYAEF